MTDTLVIEAPRRRGQHFPKPGDFTWTEERVDTLKRRWGEGASQNDIAVELGLHSRGAVSGKIARLGLSRPIQVRQRAAVERTPDGAVMPVGHLAFEHLTDDVCHFPVGDGPFLFCGSVTIVKPYCASCARIAYRAA